MSDDRFNLFGWEFKKKKEDSEILAPYVEPQKDDAALVVDDYFYGFNGHYLNLDHNFKTEDDLIKKYREISLYPEVDLAVTDIVNDSICGDNESSPVEIQLDDLEVSDAIKTKVRAEFDYLLSLMNFNNESYEIYRKWYVDGRIYYHVITDKDGIKELRYMSPLNVKKVRAQKNKVDQKSGVEVVDSIEEYYIYNKNPYMSGKRTTKGQTIRLTNDSVVTANSGLYDETSNRIYSYLHKAIKPTNVLKMMEDAIVIYRLSRAPERRIFYVDTGKLPRGKAEEYLKAVKNKYTNKMVFDTSSGEIKDSTNVLSMMEDYWMPRSDGGRATEVTTLGGAMNLGELNDLEYFQKKLYQSLNVPFGRMNVEQSTPFTIGRSQEVTREELRFSKFIGRLRKRFSGIFYELLKRQLILKNIISQDEWETFRESISFDFLTDSNFKELKEAELLRERVNTIRELDPYVGIYFSRDYVKREILKLNDEEIEKMAKEIEEEAPEEAEIEDGNPFPDK